MPQRNASAVWTGDLKAGSGTVSVGSGAFRDQSYDFGSRFEEAAGTNPEELLGAAHAGCFSMFLANLLAEDGFEARSIRTEAQVGLTTEGGARITHVRLVAQAEVPGIDEERFREHVARAERECPVSKALASLDVQVDASLVPA